MDIPEALRLIAGRSAVAQRLDRPGLRDTGREQQIRYNLVAAAALTDYDATFTPEERGAILALVDWPDDGARAKRLSIRISEDEMARAQARADAETGGNLSVLVRRLLLTL